MIVAARWAVYVRDTEDEVHVSPLNDLVEHEFDGAECACGPDAECHTQEDGPDVWLYTHHSLDGREATEGAPGD